LPSTQGDERAEQARNEWRNTIISKVTGLPHSPAELAAVLDQAGNPANGAADQAVVISKMRKLLRVNLADQTGDYDRFIVRMRDNDAGQAQAKADWVLRGIVSQLKANSRMGSGMALLNSNNSAAMAVRLGSLSNPGLESLNHSIKVEESRVEKRGAGYGLGVWLAAICLAGAAGWLMHQIARMVTELHAAAMRATRVRPAKVAAISRLSIISQQQSPQPSA
jgi:hypothetical protein